MEEQLRELIIKHCKTLEVELEAIRQCVKRLDDHAIPAIDTIKEGIEVTHKIKGSSGSIGFADISAASEILEHYFRSFPENIKTLDDKARQKLAHHFQTLEQLVTTITPENSSLFNVSLPEAKVS